MHASFITFSCQLLLKHMGYVQAITFYDFISTFFMSLERSKSVLFFFLTVFFYG